MGQEVMDVRMSQPLLSVGQMVNQGNKVVLSRNGVYVLPLWLDGSSMAFESSPFKGQGRKRL